METKKKHIKNREIFSKRNKTAAPSTESFLQRAIRSVAPRWFHLEWKMTVFVEKNLRNASSHSDVICFIYGRIVLDLMPHRWATTLDDCVYRFRAILFRAICISLRVLQLILRTHNLIRWDVAAAAATHLQFILLPDRVKRIPLLMFGTITKVRRCPFLHF